MIKNREENREIKACIKKRKRAEKEDCKRKKAAVQAKAAGKIQSGEINELIERGRPRGFVTDNEILYYFPKIEDNVKLLDEIYDRLENAGIKVIETSALIDFSKDEKDVETLDDSMDLGNDVPDAVQMYLKEIGKTPLLTKDEERDLCETRRERRRRSAAKAHEGEPSACGFHRKALREPHAASFDPRFGAGGEYWSFARRRKIRLSARF